MTTKTAKPIQKSKKLASVKPLSRQITKKLPLSKNLALSRKLPLSRTLREVF
jgi:hypothetical protein